MTLFIRDESVGESILVERRLDGADTLDTYQWPTKVGKYSERVKQSCNHGEDEGY